MIELSVDRTDYVAGDHASGVVHINGDRMVRGVRVELRSEDRSKGRHDSETISSCELPVPGGGPTLLPFRLLVPANVVRNYQLPKSSRVLFFSARADVKGLDPKGDVPIDVAPPTALGAEGIHAERHHLLERARHKRMRHLRRLGLYCFALSIVMTGVVVYWLIDPSSAWNTGERTETLLAAAFAIGAAAFGVRPLIVGWDRSINDVEIDLPITTSRPGDAISARITNGTSHPIDVGLVATERYVAARGDHDSGRVIRERRILEQWAVAPPGWSEHRFQLAHDAPPSYAGPNIGVEYEIMAVSGGPRPRRLPLRSTRRRLIVL